MIEYEFKPIKKQYFSRLARGHILYNEDTCNNLPRQSIATMEENRAYLNYKPKLVGGYKMTTNNVLSNVSSFNCYCTQAHSLLKKLLELNKIILENNIKLAGIT